MDIREYAGIASREETHFWHVGRREILREILIKNFGLGSQKKILDVGCGPGGNIAILKDFGEVTGVDFSEEALKLARNYSFAELSQADATNLPFADNSFDLVSCLDVLEHVSDDKKAIEEIWRVLRPSGLLLLTVPAYQWLWSQHDVTLHHVRRYSKDDLIKKLKQAGFQIRVCSYFVILAVPINFLRKCYDKIFFKPGQATHTYSQVLPPFINKIMLFILRCEKFLLRLTSLPFGTSIVIVAQKSSAIIHCDYCAKQIAPAARVLDVGSGRGKFLCGMAKKGFDVWGVEVNPDYIEKTRELASSQNVKIEVIQSPAEKLPFSDNNFDFVNCAEVSEHVENPLAMCQEIWRVLKPNSKCYISFHNRFGFFDYHYHLPFINFFPRSWTEPILRLLGRQKEDGAIGRQKLTTMHYFTYRQVEKMLERLGFEVRDIREEKIRAKFGRLAPIFLLLYYLLLRPLGLNAFHFLLIKRGGAPVCPLCNLTKPLIPVDDLFGIFCCTRCHHMFTVLPSEEQETYSEDYYVAMHKNWFEHPNFDLFNDIISVLNNTFAEKTISLLDIGCGKGDFLKFAAKRRANTELYGIDITGNTATGVEFIKGDFNSYTFDRKFDAIIGLMVVEHVDNPIYFVEKIYSLLNEGGLVYLVTINNDSIIYRLSRILKKLGLRGPFERLYHHHHLQHFSNASFEMLMSEAGFGLIKHKNNNFPISAIDVPAGNFLIKFIYRLGIIALFAISKVLGGEINQTVICRKMGQKK